MGTLNMILALACLAGGLLVARAYIPHVRWVRGDPVDYLAHSLGIAVAAYLARTFYWDVVWFLMGHGTSNPMVNIPISLAILWSEYLALKARLQTIPEHERAAYNVITCAWYPKNMRFRLARKKEGRQAK